MEETRKVPKVVDLLDTTKLIAEVLAAGASVVAGALAINIGVRALRFKFSNPDKYWEAKRDRDVRSAKIIAESIHHLADSLDKDNKR